MHLLEVLHEYDQGAAVIQNRIERYYQHRLPSVGGQRSIDCS